jgi:hypothetical protein
MRSTLLFLFFSLPYIQEIETKIEHQIKKSQQVKLGVVLHTDKKENQIFVIFKEIQNGAVANSYMRKGFLLIYEEMRKYLINHI